MTRQSRRVGRVLILCVVLVATAHIGSRQLTSAARWSWPQVDAFKAGAAQRAGQAWFEAEQLTADFRERIGGGFAAVKQRMLGSSEQRDGLDQLPPTTQLAEEEDDSLTRGRARAG